VPPELLSTADIEALTQRHIGLDAPNITPALLEGACNSWTEPARFGPLVYLLPVYHPTRLTEEICMLVHSRWSEG
jgi:hypothetical protein